VRCDLNTETSALNDLKSINLIEDKLPLPLIHINVLVVTTGCRIANNYMCQLGRTLEGSRTLITTPVKSASGWNLST
jgi:hypothetical protein